MRWVMLCAVSLFLGLVIRLFQVQWARSDSFDARSRQQHTAIQARVKRGRILDRNLRELAVSENVYSLVAYPTFYRRLAARRPSARIDERKRELASLIAAHLGIDAKAALRRLESAREFEWIERRMGHATAKALDDALMAADFGWWPHGGIDLRVEERRAYPNGQLAAHVIGYTNVDGEGITGVEKTYDELLRSRDVKRAALKDGKGRVIDPRAVADDAPDTGLDVVLTIDETVQHALEVELAAQCEDHAAAGGVGIVMNPTNGEIYALANYPTFDLNRYNDREVTASQRRNRAIWTPYEPGSVFKVVTLAALLHSGRARPTDVFYCEDGSYVPHARIKAIRDAHPFGSLTLADVIAKSSNIGMLKAASSLTQAEFREYVRAFGLALRTDIDLPYERTGVTSSLSDRSGYAMYYAPWGQGISVTPLQMLSAVNAIANGGLPTRPHVRRDVERADMTPVVDAHTARTAVDIMVTVVDDGSGRSAQMEGVRVAGKTGTSQKVAEGSPGYKPGAYISSFVGFFPAEAPEYSMLIVIDEPHGAHYGGQVAAPVFKRVAERIRQNKLMQPVRETLSFAPSDVDGTSVQ
jgi:stage V sporulation protein D (sporulation-specific penicillin-binding protein)